MKIKLRRKKIIRTPEQIALTCKSTKEAYKYGEEVGREFLKLHLDEAVEAGIVEKKDKN